MIKLCNLRRLIGGVLFTLLVFTFQNAHSAQTLGVLLERCEADHESARSSTEKINASTSEIYCVGYLRGLVDAMLLQQALNVENKNLGETTGLCLPASVSLKQIRMMVVKHLSENPEMHHYEPMFIIPYLQSQFPCADK